MRNFFNSHWKVIVAILIAILLAMLTIETKGSASLLPSRLQAHNAALAPDAPLGAARHVESSLRRYGYAPRLQPASGADGAARSIEAAVANLGPGMQPSHTFIIGAHLGRDGNTGASAVLELARALRDLRPALGTEIRFVFFMRDDRPDTIDELTVPPAHRGGGNFMAYIGSQASSQRVSQALASFRSDQMLRRQGLATPAHVMGVTMWQRGSGAQGGPALVITDAGFLRYPYFHAGQGREDRTDYDAMARVIHGLAGTLRALAGPVQA